MMTNEDLHREMSAVVAVVASAARLARQGEDHVLSSLLDHAQGLLEGIANDVDLNSDG